MTEATISSSWEGVDGDGDTFIDPEKLTRKTVSLTITGLTPSKAQAWRKAMYELLSRGVAAESEPP